MRTQSRPRAWCTQHGTRRAHRAPMGDAYWTVTQDMLQGASPLVNKPKVRKVDVPYTLFETPTRLDAQDAYSLTYSSASSTHLLYPNLSNNITAHGVPPEEAPVPVPARRGFRGSEEHGVRGWFVRRKRDRFLIDQGQRLQNKMARQDHRLRRDRLRVHRNPS